MLNTTLQFVENEKNSVSFIIYFCFDPTFVDCIFNLIYYLSKNDEEMFLIFTKTFALYNINNKHYRDAQLLSQVEKTSRKHYQSCDMKIDMKTYCSIFYIRKQKRFYELFVYKLRTIMNLF